MLVAVSRAVLASDRRVRGCVIRAVFKHVLKGGAIKFGGELEQIPRLTRLNVLRGLHFHVYVLICYYAYYN